MTTYCVRRRLARAPLAVTLVSLLAVPLAAAQSSGVSSDPPAPAARQTPAPTTVVVGPAYWELIGGVEADTHGASYPFFGPAYTQPIRPGLAWTVRAAPNFLAYRSSAEAGTTSVHSPGISTTAGLRFGDKNFVTVGAGPEVKFRRTTLVAADGTTTRTSDSRLGLSTGAEVYANPTSHNNVHAQVNYNTSDRYTWGRVGFKEQVSNLTWQGPNTVFLGAEGIAQGNHEIRSTQLGGLVELTHVPANLSMMFKAGFKRSTFPVGPSKTGPYFAVTFYQRLN